MSDLKEEKKETSGSRTVNSLSLFSIVAAVGTIFVLSTGLFDRGASSGTYTEKVLGLERNITRVESRLNEIDTALNNLQREFSQKGVDVSRIELITNLMEKTLTRLENELEIVKRSQ